MDLTLIFIPRKPRFTLGILLLILVFTFPYALRFDLVGQSSTENLVGRSPSSEIPVFFEGTNELIVLLSSQRDPILTENVRNWTEFFKFFLDQNYQQFIDFRKEKLDIFWLGNNLLSSYLRNVQLAVIGLNISYLILIKQTGEILKTVFQGISSNKTNVELHFVFRSNVNQTLMDLKNIPLGLFLEETVRSWFDALENKLDTWINFNLTSLSDFLNAVQEDLPNPSTLFGESPISDFAQAVLKEFQIGQDINSSNLFNFAGNLLFGSASQQDVDFLKQIFANANLVYPVQLARNNSLEFLNYNYIPVGFNMTVLDIYMSLYTNSANQQFATKTILRIPLTNNVTPYEVNQLIEDLKGTMIVKDLKQLNVEISFLNLPAMADSLDVQFQRDLYFIDIFATLAGFVIFFILFRRFAFAFLASLVNLFSILIIRGFLVLFVIDLIEPTQIDLSISSILVYGAGLNYTIFFMFRFFEERVDLQFNEAIHQTLKNAGHSIMVSSIAVMMSLFPLTFSSVKLLSAVSVLTICGLILQLAILMLAFPSIFFLVQKKWEFPSINKTSVVQPKKMFISAKKVISLLLLLTAMSVMILSVYPPQSTPNDFISLNEEQSQVLATIYNEFEESVFSQVIITLKTNQSLVYDNGSLNIESVIKIADLSSSLAMIPQVRQVLSVAWPLGSPFDFSNNSLGLVYKETARVSAKQFINGNLTYLLVSLYRSDNQIDLLSPVIEMEEKAIQFSDASDFQYVSIIGFIPSIAKLNQKMVSDAPPRFLFSIFLLTIFLGVIFKSIVNAPIRLIISVLVSSIVSLAIATLISNLIFGSPLNLGVFTFSVFILFAFAIDFDVYLYSRFIEELQHENDPVTALFQALSFSGRSIRASGLLMITTFASLFLSTFPILLHAGLILIVSIFFDVFILRSYVFPGLLLLNTRKVTQ